MKIKIKEPWWGAWKRFGWSNRWWGVGLKKEDVEKAIKDRDVLEIEVWEFDDKYEVSPEEVKEYAKKNKTQFMAKKDTLLYVIPKVMLRKVAG